MKALLLISIASIVVGTFLGLYIKELELTNLILNLPQCYSDSDCSWVITNCCPEQAGAKWECVNLKTYKPKECPDIVICPQVISPKPEQACICKEGSCVVR